MHMLISKSLYFLVLMIKFLVTLSFPLAVVCCLCFCPVKCLLIYTRLTNVLCSSVTLLDIAVVLAGS